MNTCLKKLTRRKALGNLRELCIPQPLIDFSSNDALGLARCPELAATTVQEWQKQSGSFNGLGSTGSRLLTGNSLYAQELEERIAQFHGYEAGALFSCGYMANVGLLPAVADSNALIFFDAGIHASTRDGMRLSRAQAFPFRHNDLEHLKQRLKNRPSQKTCFVCIESLYSTDGSRAPLVEICQLVNQHEAHLIVDEAHAVGVCGPKGRGLIAEQALVPHVFAQIVTFGKALGTYGAIVLGSHALKQTLINFATSFIYTTALPLQLLAAIKCSYDRFPAMEQERQHLRHLTGLFPRSSCTHIQRVPVQGNAAAKCAAHSLKEQGFDVRPLLSPTVQRGEEGLRVCLHAFNTSEELTTLIRELRV